MKSKMILLAGAIALALASPTFAHAKSVRVNFSKCELAAVPAGAPFGTIATNEGSTTGAATGHLFAHVVAGSFEMLGPGVVFLSAQYIVDGPRAFTAHVVGRFDTNPGGVAELRGVVSKGWLAGSRVVDRFVRTTPGCVAGTLTLTPWPLDDDDDDD
jgi:hypothetical protein